MDSPYEFGFALVMLLTGIGLVVACLYTLAMGALGEWKGRREYRRHVEARKARRLARAARYL